MRAIKKASDAWHCEAKIFVFPKPLDLSYLLPFVVLGGYSLMVDPWMDFWKV